jgi:arylsulfatase A-like enzyme
MFNLKKTIFLTGTVVILILGGILILQYILPLLPKPDISGKLDNYNLIIINIDALRGDHLGCYGYHRNTSPFIDSLAQKGAVFERAMSNSAFTRESVSVLFTGKLPASGGSVGWNAKPSKKNKTIGELFEKVGYNTGFFSNSNALKSPGFTRGFKEIWFNEKWGVSRNGPELSKHAGEFIKKCKNRGQKFMIYLHFLDPHGPYKPPKQFYLRFAQRLYPGPLHVYQYVRMNCENLIKEGFGPGEERFEDMVLRYDAEIAHVDHSIKLLFIILKKHDLLNHTFVVITADHGEEFLEHDYVEHGWTLYNESLHIPVILWAPGIIPAKRFKTLVSTVDMLPTILGLMGIPHNINDFNGSFLFKHKGNGFYFTPPEKPYISESFLKNRNHMRAVIKDNWKYITAIKWVPPRERPEALKNAGKPQNKKEPQLNIWGPVVHEELYNLSKDPKEKNNLLDKEKRRELWKIIQKYRIYCWKRGIKITPSTDKKSPISEKDKKKLKSLGYLRP